MGNVFNSGSDGVLSCERGVYDDSEMFNLEVSLVQGFKGASIIEVMIEWYGKMRVRDGSDKRSVFGGRWERAEAVAVDKDVDREDRGDFYSRWRRRCNYRRGKGQWGRCGEFGTARRWSMFGEPKLSTFCGEEEAGSPARSGDIGWQGIRGRGMRCQGSGGCQGWRAHVFRVEV